VATKTQKKPTQKTPAKRPVKKSSKAAKRWTQTHLIILVLVTSGLLTACICVILALFVSLRIPTISSLADYRPPLTTVILDRAGNKIDRIFHQNRFLVEIDNLPQLLPKAFLAAEDARFYSHRGVDAWSILRALFHNISEGDRSQGGSTITQQVARSLLLSPEKTYSRKVKEAILAYRIDQVFSKKDILTIYLNQIYFGSGAYGVEAAAQTYFGKHARNLSLAEIAMLAGLPQAPSRYSPLKNYEKARKRQAYVLNRMAAEGYITATAARKAFNEKIQVGQSFKKEPAYQYFLQQVKKQLTRKYGAPLLAAGGFTIHTTLDGEMQIQAAKAVQNGISAWRKRQNKDASSLTPQTALIAMEVENGFIRALIGGTNFRSSQFNRAIQAKRQPGSAFKPIIYATAFEQGYNPGSIFIDEPLSLPGSHSGNVWQPENFSGDNYGPTTLRDGLIYSRNIVTIKVLQEIGVKPVTKLAQKLGIRSSITENLSLALGTSEVSLLELTSVYGALANEGDYISPVFIEKITDKNGNAMEKAPQQSTRVLNPQTAFQVTHLLEKVIEQGTGRKARGLGIPAAGKTGTSDRNQDAWFIGYTPSMVSGVWLGFDRKKTLGRKETGGRAAAPVWRDFMGRIKHRLSKDDFTIPTGIRIIPMDIETGLPREIDGAEKVSWEAFREEDIERLKKERTEITTPSDL